MPALITGRDNLTPQDTNTHASLTKNNKNKINTNKTKATFSHLLRHPAWKRSATILVEWEDMKSKKIDEA